MRYQLAYKDESTSLKVEDFEAAVTGLALAQRDDKAPLLALETIRLASGRGDVIAREFTISEISLSRGRLAATMARDGTVNWQRLMVTAPAAAAAPPATAGARPLRLAVEKVRAEEVALSFVDQSRAAPLAVEVAGLTVDLSARLESGPAGLAGTVEGVGVKLERVAMGEVATTIARLADGSLPLVKMLGTYEAAARLDETTPAALPPLTHLTLDPAAVWR